MRKVINTILVISAVLFLGSCEKEFDNKQVYDLESNKETVEQYIMTVEAGAPETKTAIAGTVPTWKQNDVINVVYTNTSASIDKAESSPLASDAADATFTVGLTNPDNSITAYAYYPSNAIAATNTTATLTIAADQKPSISSFDGDSDILISDGFVPAASVHPAFKRLGAVLKIRIQNEKLKSEKLVNLTTSYSAGSLSGDVAVTMATGVIAGISNGGNVTASYEDAKQFVLYDTEKAGDDKYNYVYLIVIPQTLEAGETLTISGETTNTTFTKTITLPEIELSNGHIKPLAITIADANITLKDNCFLAETWSGTTGTGGNDLKWSGSIATNSVVYDGDDWTVANCGGANKCLRLGTGSKKGSAETPSGPCIPNNRNTWKGCFLGLKFS